MYRSYKYLYFFRLFSSNSTPYFCLEIVQFSIRDFEFKMNDFKMKKSEIERESM